MRQAFRRGALLAMSFLTAAGAWMLTGREVAFVRVAGGSMYPALRLGDVCIVRLGGQFEPGDVVLFQDPGHPTRVLHRVESVDAEGVVTRGDANLVADHEPLPRRSVVGPVVAVVPAGKALEALAASIRR